MSIGSTWRKWNLHIHSPSTIFNNNFKAEPPFTDVWETYIHKLSKTDTNVFGITDYYSIQGYLKTMEYFNAGRLPNVELLIPNIELRLLPSTKDGRAINFHILCDPRIVPDLDHLFFSKLRFEYNGNEYSLAKDDLIRLGRAYKKDSTLDPMKALEEGTRQFKTDIKTLQDLYRKNQILRDHTITVVANSNKDGASAIQESSLTSIREEIYRFSNIVFSPREKDIKFFLGKGVCTPQDLIEQYGSLKPCVNGCDAHENNQICKAPLNRFTWIKADTTFSGLKQVIFEPETRVTTRDNKPRPPGKTINMIDITFPAGCRMDNETFCFGYSFRLNFSPYFTCIIGGRGTGKSTLLNMIGAKLQKGNNDFFRERPLKDASGKKIQIPDNIKIDGDQDEKIIEFLSQNEIEEFAKDATKLTNAIYSRIINLDTEDILVTSAKSLTAQISSLKTIISNKISLRNGKDEIERKRREIETLNRIIQSFESEEYKLLNENVEKSLIRLNEIIISETKYIGLVDNLQEVLSNYHAIDTSNQYVQAGAELSGSVQKIVDEYRSKNFSEVLEEKATCQIEYNNARTALQEYLQKSGVSTEDQKDITNANATIIKLRAEIERDNREIEELQAVVNDFSLEELEQKSILYRELLVEHIDKVQNMVDDLNTNKKLVKTISLKYDFDYYKAQEQILRDFQILFRDAIQSFNEKLKFDTQSLERLLYNYKPVEGQTNDDYVSRIDADVTRSNAKQFLKELFSESFNFELFQLLIKLAKLDHFTFKKILVYYDNKPVDTASFGQRCTAALVILLLLGNNPIIIDEPEAHLDSMLISNYLVEVIKKRKNERQIIFATHNANFVINGDAELIHILDVNDKTNLTEITSTTIENESTRENLVALEGGKEAFKKREHRYTNRIY